MKRILTILLIAAMTCGLFAACAKTEETPTTLTVNEVTHSVFYAPFYAAIELGYFEDEGLTIELVNGGGADTVMTAVLTDQAHIGLAGPEASIYVENADKDDATTIFAQLTKRDGSFLMGREDVEFDWSQTVGATIIGGRAGGVPEMTLEYVMKQNGVEPHVDAIVDTAVEFSMMAGAFAGGMGDYVTLFEPTATQMELEGAGYILTSIGQESGEIPYTAFFTLDSFMESYPETVQAFTNAIARGQSWVQTASVADIASAIAPQFPDTDLDILEAVAQRYQDIDAWSSDPVMTEESLTRLQDVMEAAGQLTKRAIFSEVVDNSFAEAAK